MKPNKIFFMVLGFMGLLVMSIVIIVYNNSNPRNHAPQTPTSNCRIVAYGNGVYRFDCDGGSALKALGEFAADHKIRSVSKVPWEGLIVITEKE